MPCCPLPAFYVSVIQHVSEGYVSLCLRFVTSGPQAPLKTKWRILKGIQCAARYASTLLINSVNNTFVKDVMINTVTYSLFSHDKDGSVDLSYNMVSTPRCLRTNPQSEGSEQSVVCRIPGARQRNWEWG
jgi:hypothetical protein